MFPFKFELKEAIVDYHSKGRPEMIFNNQTIAIAQNELFSFYFMFLSYEKRDNILEYVDSINKSFYHINIPKGIDEYISTLPKILYTIAQFDKPDLVLMDLLGIPANQNYHLKSALNYVVEYIKKHYPKHAVSSYN